MAPASDFTELVVWQKAHALTLDVYRCIASFPRDERFGLTSQFRRAAVSIGANIAEGFRKRSVPDKARFFNIAEGSVSECHYYVLLANDLGYPIDKLPMLEQVNEISRLLHSYIAAMQRNAKQ